MVPESFGLMARIVTCITFEDNPRWSEVAAIFELADGSRGEIWGTLLGLGMPLFRCVAVGKVDALPAEEACIDRPCARPEQRQGGTEGSKQDITPRIVRMREGAPHFNDCQERSRDGRP